MAQAREVEVRRTMLTRTKGREEGKVGMDIRQKLISCKRALVLCLCIVGLCATMGQSALAFQESIPPNGEVPGADLQIQQLRVQVMPEFDDPRVLVILQGRLATSQTSFPQSITFRVPKGAQINQMAGIEIASGNISSQPYELRPDPTDARWSLVTYTLDNAHFFYEYYFDPLVGETDKQLAFTFSSLQPVVDLVLEVQQPLAATHFALDSPSTSTRFDDAIGMTYHQVRIGALPADGEALVHASYTKADPAPSISRQQPAPAKTNDRTQGLSRSVAAASQPAGTPPILLLVVLACTMAAGLIFFFWFRAHQNNTTLAPVLEASLGPFCRRCGTVLRRNAQFCHLCGTCAEPGLEP